MEKIPDSSETATAGGRKARAHRLSVRDAVHVLVVLTGWVLFFFWWGEVISTTSLAEAAVAVLIVLGVSLVTALGTTWWVRYNIGIYRRKGPRRTVTDAREDAEADVLGRGLDHPGVERLRASRLVTVSLAEGDRKSLLPEDG